MILKQHYLLVAGTGTWAMGDLNGDRKVDLDDFVILNIHFGAFTPPPNDPLAPPGAAPMSMMSASTPAIPRISDLDGDGDIDFDDYCVLLAQSQGQ